MNAMKEKLARNLLSQKSSLRYILLILSLVSLIYLLGCGNQSQDAKSGCTWSKGIEYTTYIDWTVMSECQREVLISDSLHYLELGGAGWDFAPVSWYMASVGFLMENEYPPADVLDALIIAQEWHITKEINPFQREPSGITLAK